MANEGLDFRFRIHPLTAIALALVIASGSFGLGILARFPLANYFPFLSSSIQPTSPTTSTLSWRDTAFMGTLHFSTTTNKYYLTTNQSEAITLDVPTNVNLSKLVNKRIFAAGSYSKETKVLKVQDATSMEVLPTTITPVPTTSSSSATPN